MKNLRLISMLLVSHREKKARKIDFHPEVTVIQGENDTGKSSVIKSIQYVFGANPHKVHPNWKQADVAILLRFTLDGVIYSIYRHRNSFSLFDFDDKKIGTYSSVTLELSPILAKLFDFNLKLTDREGVSVVPPPAYLMLPFYIDQDGGWSDKWNSFANLGQFAYWKQRVTGYHYGTRPDKWYELEAKKKSLECNKAEPIRQMNSVQSVRARVYSDMSRVDFDIDVESFRNEIDRLLTECEVLKAAEVKFRNKKVELRTEKIKLEAQIEIVARTHDELSDDYKYSCQLNNETVDCPTCGANYDNSFSERFDIAQDTETCTDLLASLRQDLEKVESDIKTHEELLAETGSNINDINAILAEKQGNIKLQDLIDIEGKRALLKHLDKEYQACKTNIDRLEEEISGIEEDMDKYDNTERRREIISEYGENLRKNTQRLSVHSLSDNVFKDINSSIEESGSDLPRAILAYFFTTLSAIEKNGNATYFPIVIDAPNQQEQDPKNLKKVLEFIIASRPQGKQLILGLVDDSDVKFDGKTITFDKKYSVLNQEDYFEVTEEIRHFEVLNLSIDQNN
ncbi:MAG: AAA family ATPase [Methylophilus sp.]